MSSLHREGTCGLREQSKSHVRGFIGFLCKPRNISLFFSPLLSLSPAPSILRVSLDPAKAGPWQFPTLCNPMDYTYTVRGILQGRILEWVDFPFSRGSSQSRDRTQVFALQAILYQLSHKGTRILEWVAYPFSRGSSCPQESNQGLLHCRWILYQLSYEGSPYKPCTILFYLVKKDTTRIL